MRSLALLATAGSCVLIATALLGAAPAGGPPAVPKPPPAGLEARRPGETVAVGGLSVTVKEIRNVPLVENDFSKRFLYDSPDNPKLIQLRQQEKLDQVVAPGQTEFQRQVLLLDWAYRRFKKFGKPSSEARGAMDILKAIDEGHTFFCSHYAQVFSSAASSLGWVDRTIGVRVGNGDRCLGKSEGYTEHSITEIWSNQHGKWVMMDPTFATYVQKDGVPLGAWEIRQEWFYCDANALDFVIGAQQKHYGLGDLPVVLANHKGYGNLSLERRTFDVYGFLMYSPYTHIMDAKGLPDRLFISKDSLCDGVKWHTRDNPKDPAKEPYFPLQQAALKILPASSGAAGLAVQVGTQTPNFAGFRRRLDGGRWQDLAPARSSAKPVPAAIGAPAEESAAAFDWPIHEGTNTLEVQAVNTAGVEGMISAAVLEAKK